MHPEIVNRCELLFLSLKCCHLSKWPHYLKTVHHLREAHSRPDTSFFHLTLNLEAQIKGSVFYCLITWFTNNLMSNNILLVMLTLPIEISKLLYEQCIWTLWQNLQNQTQICLWCRTKHSSELFCRISWVCLGNDASEFGCKKVYFTGSAENVTIWPPDPLEHTLEPRS